MNSKRALVYYHCSPHPARNEDESLKSNYKINIHCLTFFFYHKLINVYDCSIIFSAGGNSNIVRRTCRTILWFIIALIFIDIDKLKK